MSGKVGLDQATAKVTAKRSQRQQSRFMVSPPANTGPAKSFVK
jgi:hypothetical protein